LVSQAKTNFVTGPGLGLDEKSKPLLPAKEHIIQIDIDLSLPGSTTPLRDSFTWDLANPDNCPEEFARALLSDCKLDKP